MLRPLNPYIAGKPLSIKDHFYDRRDIINWASIELSNPYNNGIVLYGQRRIGKTSLLLHLQHHLDRDGFLPVYFDLQDQATRPLGEVLSDLAYTTSHTANIEEALSNKFDNRGDSFISSFIPKLSEVLPENCRPVFLLDEFDVLDQSAESILPSNAAISALFPFFRRLITAYSRLAFVFVIGRRAEDLSPKSLSLFKGFPTREVWVLDREGAEAVIRQAEENNTLFFADSAIDRILSLTSGHPFLTQLLCQQLWQEAYLNNPDKPPKIDPPHVESAVNETLEVGQAALFWLWNGLNPIERIHTAALAEATHEGEIVSEENIQNILAPYQARLRKQEAELMPMDLVSRRVLNVVDANQYQFAVELIRRWVRRYRPLKDLKDEFDRIEPIADKQYYTGLDFFQNGDLEKSVHYLHEALQLNPLHLRARLVLAECLLTFGETRGAIAELEKAYKLDREEARLPFARALLVLAQGKENSGDDEGALSACEQVLQLFPEPTAFQIKSRIWSRRGDEALKKNQLEEARNCYLRAENSDKAGVIEQIIKNKLQIGMKSRMPTYSQLNIEYTPPNEYRVSWYQADQVVQSAERVHSDLQFSLSDWREQPKDCGRTAFDHFLPLKSQKFIRAYVNWAIQISTDLADVPWELLHDGQEFLCLSRPIGRKIQLLKEPEKYSYELDRPLSALVVGNPTDDLPGTQSEAEAIAKLLEQSGVNVDLMIGSEEAKAKRFSIKLSNNRYDFIHYAGHGYFKPEAPHLSGLKFPDAIINAGELERGLKSQAFVFLSACEAAQAVSLESSFGFRGKFIEGLAISVLLGGAKGCLGPLWPISDGLAKDFALDFYRRLLVDQEPIGEAVRLARLAVRDRSPDFWASWVLYGDPLQKLL